MGHLSHGSIQCARFDAPEELVTISVPTMNKYLISNVKEAFRDRAMFPEDYRIASRLPEDQSAGFSWISHSQ
jgi:hypothetical protein